MARVQPEGPGRPTTWQRVAALLALASAVAVVTIGVIGLIGFPAAIVLSVSFGS